MPQPLLTVRSGPGRVRSAAVLLAFAWACASAPAPRGGMEPGAARPAVRVEEEPGVPPRWDSSAGVRHIWPQIALQAEMGQLCPFVVHRQDATAPYLTVRYDASEVRTGPYALHLRFRATPSAVAGWGVGCLRRYDLSLQTHATFWARGEAGTRFFFRLRDADEVEASIEIVLRRSGWQRVVVPLRELGAVNLRQIISVAFGFTGAQGDADLHIDDLEFSRGL